MTGQSSKAAIVLCVCSFYSVQYLYVCFFVRLAATSFKIVILWFWKYIACKKRKIMFEFTEAIFVEVISFSFINTFYRFPLLESFLHKKWQLPYTPVVCLFSIFLGRKIAIDASMSIYQFLIAVRSDGSQLTNEAGEITRLKHQYKLN